MSAPQIGDIAARLAHDTTALCRNIAFLSDMVSEDADDPDRVRKLSQQIKDKSRKLFALVRMTRRITDLASHRTACRVIDLRPAARAAVTRAGGRLGRFECFVDGEGAAWTDAHLLDLALDALTENAADHGADKGNFTIRIDGSVMRVTSAADVQATAADFTPFRSRDPASHAGLGLALVAHILERVGGSARASHAGREKFGITLEMAAEKPTSRA